MHASLLLQLTDYGHFVFNVPVNETGGIRELGFDYGLGTTLIHSLALQMGKNSLTAHFQFRCDTNDWVKTCVEVKMTIA